jgi:ribosomal silencing factor RsfS
VITGAAVDSMYKKYNVFDCFKVKNARQKSSSAMKIKIAWQTIMKYRWILVDYDLVVMHIALHNSVTVIVLPLDVFA